MHLHVGLSTLRDSHPLVSRIRHTRILQKKNNQAWLNEAHSALCLPNAVNKLEHFANSTLPAAACAWHQINNCHTRKGVLYKLRTIHSQVTTAKIVQHLVGYHAMQDSVCGLSVII